MLTTKLNLPHECGGRKEIYDFATLSGIDRPQWRSSQRSGAGAETVVVTVAVFGGEGVEKRGKSGKDTAAMKVFPQKQNPVWQREQKTMPSGDGECNQSQWPS